MRWSIFHFKSNRSSFMWQHISEFAGEVAYGTTTQRPQMTGRSPWSGRDTDDLSPVPTVPAVI
jgi:hypothetical protein